MRAFLILSVIVLISFLFILFAGNQNEVGYGSACFRGNCFSVEIPLTDEGVSRGLMFREQLDADKGMLFVFEKEDIYPFWMKNTLIPLDIIWLNESMDVVYISANTQPCNFSVCPSIRPEKPARYVLEINSGLADTLGIKLGDKVIINIPAA